MRSYKTFFCRAWPTVLLLAVGLGLSSRNALADSFDWRSVGGYNWNTPVRDQFAGTCWDYSTIATTEAKYKLTRNDPNFNPDLAEQQLVSETNPDMGSTNGGGASGATMFQYISTHGIVSETELPMTGDEYNGTPPSASYWPLQSGWQNRVWKCTTSAQVDYSAGTASIQAWKNIITQYGPLMIGIDSNSWFYQPYNGPPTNPGGGHIIEAEGFCDDPVAPGGGYFIIKNSWGASWNGNGYATIGYDCLLDYATNPTYVTGAVYYSGAMLSQTWTGTASGGPIWVASTSSK